MVPSLRFVVPSMPELTPPPAVGLPLAVSGGQPFAQAPKHVDFAPVSLANV